MKRKITEELLKWKNSNKRKPLIVTGVRQCGKTYTLKEFGKDHYEKIYYVNLEKNEIARSVFEQDYDVKRIVDELGILVFGEGISPDNSLLILDEIQECPRAITSLKYFYEDMPQQHIVCAGSLLGVFTKKKPDKDSKQKFTFPVGKVDEMTMYPMSFEEFVIADGGEKYITYFSNQKISNVIPDVYTSIFEKYLKNYYIVGGMPEAVKAWAESHDYSEIDNILDSLIVGYEGDFGKHANINDVPKMRWIWNSVPVQLARENNKFIFSHVKEGKRSAELEDALQWLINAGLIFTPFKVSNPTYPLSSEADETYFKVYLCDNGLLRRRLGIGYRAMIENNVSDNIRGAFAENFVYNELVKQSFKPYFYRNGNGAEVDFIIGTETGNIYPIEVKSADNTRAKSFANYLKQYKPKTGFKMSLKNVSYNTTPENNNFYSLPLYMIWRMREYLENN